MKRLFLPVLGLLSLLLIFSSHKLHAAEIQVSPDTGDIASAIDNDGKCTLMEAMMNAHYDGYYMGTFKDCEKGSGDDVISLPAGTYRLTKPISKNSVEGTPPIEAKLTIQGAGARDTIIQRDASAADKFRIFYVDTTGDLTLKGVTVQNGLLETESGGAIYNGGTLKVVDSQFKNNSGKRGGAIFSAGNSPSLTILNSTFLKNQATNGDGGALVSGAVGALLINNTFSENSALGGSGAAKGGGAISARQGTMGITHNTFYNNSGDPGGAIRIASDVTIANSLLVGNQPKNCDGTFVDAQNNLDSGNTCAFETAKGNIVDQTDAKLAALGDNGGSTDTHALMSGSPAIDNGDKTICLAQPPYGLPNDQRGLARPVGVSCDMGSYEKGTCGDSMKEPEEECDGGADCDSSCKVTTSTGSGGSGGTPSGTAPASSSGCSLVKTSAGALNWMWLGMFVPGVLFVSLKKRKG